MPEIKKPPALNIYKESAEILAGLEAAEVGNSVLAAVKYYLYDEMPERLTRVEQIVFQSLKNGIDRSTATYQEQCEKRRAAANARWNNTE